MVDKIQHTAAIHISSELEQQWAQQSIDFQQTLDLIPIFTRLIDATNRSVFEEKVSTYDEGVVYVTAIKDDLLTLVDYSLAHNRHEDILDTFDRLLSYDKSLKYFYQVFYDSVPNPMYRPSELAQYAIVNLLSDKFFLSQLSSSNYNITTQKRKSYSLGPTMLFDHDITKQVDIEATIFTK